MSTSGSFSLRLDGKSCLIQNTTLFRYKKQTKLTCGWLIADEVEDCVVTAPILLIGVLMAYEVN